ncbi:hypothetical protein PC118_g8778 [Phytophthora cactorum]|uniref:Uncharacterized protein n=1 Tax=Phytophthora cactorum TaxID=29920 RepID=A0A8T1GAI7_9STRA|nr:hypothetical protein PC111_g10610 [Phytophthora cactorum]KAG2984612.1 hypothetical protein PC118_g8778 [Phytophthora cactorum]
MSGFLPLEDLEPTLSDVLAFIDTFDSDTTASTASSSSSDNGNSPRPSPSPQSAVERRKTRKAAASRRCQQKKRAELLALRAQVTALESRLKELSTEKRTGSVGTRLDRNQRLSVTQLWRDKALLEQQLRRQSEERNRQLMAVVARQSSVAQTVRNVLNGVTNVVNIEEALRTPPPTNTPSVLEGFVPNLHDAIYGELSANLSRMYVDVNTRFTSLGTIMIQDVSTGVHVMTDAVTGVPFVELKTATTTSLSLKDTEKVVMCLKACHYNRYRKYLTELGVKKETEYELRDEEMALALSCLSLSRSYEEENRRMLTFSTLVCDHPTESELRFREEGFVVATRSPINPLAEFGQQDMVESPADPSKLCRSATEPSRDPSNLLDNNAEDRGYLSQYRVHHRYMYVKTSVLIQHCARTHRAITEQNSAPQYIMSFLATEEDKSILNEALAFIEACGSGETSTISVDTTDDSSGLDDVPSLDDLINSNSLELLNGIAAINGAESSATTPTTLPPKAKTQKPKQKSAKKRRVRSAETSSTGLQRRKRAELASLREQVEELQGVLDQLKHAGHLSLFQSVDGAEPSSAPEGETQWHGRAIEQYRLRLQAEKVHRHLIAITKNHNKVREALCGVLQKRSVLYGMDYLKNDKLPRRGAALSGVSPVDSWMAQLENTAEHLRLLSSRFEIKQQLLTSVNNAMQFKYDERRKTKIIEFETTTPLNCSLQEASSFLWSDFRSDRILGTKPDTLIKKTMLTMPSCKGAIIAEKLHFLRKYQYEGQMVLTWADIMVLPGKRELQFRTEGIILLSTSTANPDQTLCRSFLKLYLDINDVGCQLRPEDVAYAQDIVLGAMAMKLRLYWQSFQNMLIDGANRTSCIC